MIITKNYTYHRIKKILDVDFNLALIRTPSGYKGFRHKVQTYYLLDMDTNQIITKDVTLDALRIMLTGRDYPLTEN